MEPILEIVKIGDDVLKAHSCKRNRFFFENAYRGYV